MAKIIPYYISKKIKSSGERKIFEYLESDSGSKDWVVLHSLNIMQHTSNLYGEIDFVVFAPGKGIFCLEVKSGRVIRENGVWYYVDRFGNKHKSSRGPFKQVQEGMFSLMDNISRQFGSG